MFNHVGMATELVGSDFCRTYDDFPHIIKTKRVFFLMLGSQVLLDVLRERWHKLEFKCILL